jgi:HSP20 family protein
MALPTTRGSVTGEIDTLFDQLLDDWGFPRMTMPTVAARALPAVDIYEKDGRYVTELAVPGYKNDNINVEVNGNVLTVSGQYDESTAKDDAKYHRREIRRGSFSRSIALPQEIDPNSVQAKVERGILTVSMSPVKPIAPKKIPISGG